MSIRTTVCAVLGFCLPTALARPLLNLLGHRLARDTQIGWSWVYCDLLVLKQDARIGHFNLVSVRRLLLHEGAYLGRANILRGPINVVLKARAAIGNGNRILRGREGVSSGSAQLWLGELAKITAEHRIDCTQTVRIGAFSTLGGAGSQVWTHGYVHDTEGEGRYRIDGAVEVERNVYVGSACVISMGVRLAQGVIVGSGTTVSKSLVEPGLYVSAAVRALSRPENPESRADLQRLADPLLCETVYLKRRP